MQLKDDLLKKFPKTRPPLPPEFEKIHITHYMQNRRGETPASFVSQKMESWMHIQVAADTKGDKTCKTTLEIGAGTLNQLSYEPDYGPYDIIEPFQELYETSSSLNRIHNIYHDIREISGHKLYDRITSIAVLEHICNLPEVIARSGLLLKPNGLFRASIPSEGTILWTLGWKLTTGIEFRIKYGLDKGIWMKHEHVNNSKEIENLLKYFFGDVHGKVFGLCKGFSLYQFYSCKNPVIKRCLEYVEWVDRSNIGQPLAVVNNSTLTSLT